MKKSELIKLLENIDGDPEICLYNELVGDYQYLSKKIHCYRLVKFSLEYYQGMLEMEERRYKNYDDPMSVVLTQEDKDKIQKEAKELFESQKHFEFSNDYVQPETDGIYERWYDKFQDVIILQPKKRKKSVKIMDGFVVDY